MKSMVKYECNNSEDKYVQLIQFYLLCVIGIMEDFDVINASCLIMTS